MIFTICALLLGVASIADLGLAGVIMTLMSAGLTILWVTFTRARKIDRETIEYLTTEIEGLRKDNLACKHEAAELRIEMQRLQDWIGRVIEERKL